jgi:hypothetical protein
VICWPLAVWVVGTPLIVKVPQAFALLHVAVQFTPCALGSFATFAVMFVVAPAPRIVGGTGLNVTVTGAVPVMFAVAKVVRAGSV